MSEFSNSKQLGECAVPVWFQSMFMLISAATGILPSFQSIPLLWQTAMKEQWAHLCLENLTKSFFPRTSSLSSSSVAWHRNTKLQAMWRTGLSIKCPFDHYLGYWYTLGLPFKASHSGNPCRLVSLVSVHVVYSKATYIEHWQYESTFCLSSGILPDSKVKLHTALSVEKSN